MKALQKTGLITVGAGEEIRLKSVDADDTGHYRSQEDTVQRLAHLTKELEDLQERLYAEGQRSFLIVLQAMDTGGKDGALKRLMTGINPAGVHVTSFKAPSATELAHDFLWRIHAAAPSRGRIGVWNRSHYEDVLVTRVHKLISKKVCKQRYEDINEFERMLTDNGTTVCKFFLYISKDEQRKRLQARLDDPDKHWKFSTGDLTERKLWSNYMEAYEDAINATSTHAAPWHVVPANHKWVRDLALAECVVAQLKKMDPKFPQVHFDAAKVVIED